MGRDECVCCRWWETESHFCLLLHMEETNLERQRFFGGGADVLGEHSSSQRSHTTRREAERRRERECEDVR